MNKSFIVSIITVALVASCRSTNEQPTPFPSSTPEPVPSITSTATRLPPTAIPPTSTVTPLPSFSTKQVLLDYYSVGDHSVYDMFFVEDLFTWSKLVLYTDGQLIIPGDTYQQKLLSAEEITRFLAQLEAFGFYSIESNQKHDPTDKLYDFGDNYQKSFDGLFYCVLVQTDESKELCVYEPNMQFVIPKMRSILNFLDEYQPEKTSIYSPDRILLWIQRGRNSYDEKLPTNTIPWPESLPSLETSSEKIMYVDRDAASAIYSLFENNSSGKVFTQDGMEYSVYFQIVLPHEVITNAYQ